MINKKQSFIPADLKFFFTSHLDKLYWSKMHLYERIPDLISQTKYDDLRQALFETINDVRTEIAQIEKVYSIITTLPRSDKSDSICETLDHDFSTIHLLKGSHTFRNLSTILYLYAIHNQELLSSNVLQMILRKIENKQLESQLQCMLNGRKGVRVLIDLLITKF